MMTFETNLRRGTADGFTQRSLTTTPPRQRLAAPILKTVEVEQLAREIEVLTASKPKKLNPTLLRHDRIRNTAVKIYHAAMSKVLAGAEAEVLRNLHSQKPAGTIAASRVDNGNGQAIKIAPRANGDVLHAAETPPQPETLNFDLETFARKFLNAMRFAGASAFEQTSNSLGLELGLGERETDQGIVQDFLNKRENKISGCSQEIYDSINRVLKQGIDAGDPYDDIAEAIQGEFDGISKGRALLIAQTEAQSVYGTAQMDNLDAAGFTTKRWQTAEDELVRESHAECEDEGAIANGDEFSNGLMFPGDPDGDASEVINCRCFLTPGNEDEGMEDDE